MNNSSKIATYDEIQFLKPGIGYFPSLDEFLNHGFSWSPKNMEFDSGEYIEVRKNIDEFMKEMKFPDFRECLFMGIEHKDNINFVDKDNLELQKRTRFGIIVKGDALFTNIQNLPICIKVADCTTAIVYAKSGNNSITGIIHTGRRGVELKLPEKAINYLINNFHFKHEGIRLAIIPHLFYQNRKFQNLDQINQETWKDYIEVQDNNFLIKETEFAIDQYINSGILSENIEVYNIDTYESAKNKSCFSYKYNYEMTQASLPGFDGRFIVATSLR